MRLQLAVQQQQPNNWPGVPALSGTMNGTGLQGSSTAGYRSISSFDDAEEGWEGIGSRANGELVVLDVSCLFVLVTS